MNTIQKQDMVVDSQEEFDSLPTEPEAVYSPPQIDDTDEVIPVGEASVVFKPSDEPVEEWPIEGTEAGSYDMEVPQEHTGHIGADFFRTDGEWKETKIGTLPNGKVLHVAKVSDGTGYKIKYSNATLMPAELTGVYTTYFMAERAARLYIAQEHEKNAKTSGR